MDGRDQIWGDAVDQILEDAVDQSLGDAVGAAPVQQFKPGQGPHLQHLQGSAVHVLKSVLRSLFTPAEQHKVPADLSSAGLKADFDATWLLALAAASYSMSVVFLLHLKCHSGK